MKKILCVFLLFSVFLLNGCAHNYNLALTRNAKMKDQYVTQLDASFVRASQSAVQMCVLLYELNEDGFDDSALTEIESSIGAINSYVNKYGKSNNEIQLEIVQKINYFTINYTDVIDAVKNSDKTKSLKNKDPELEKSKQRMREYISDLTKYYE